MRKPNLRTYFCLLHLGAYAGPATYSIWSGGTRLCLVAEREDTLLFFARRNGTLRPGCVVTSFTSALLPRDLAVGAIPAPHEYPEHQNAFTMEACELWLVTGAVEYHERVIVHISAESRENQLLLHTEGDRVRVSERAVAGCSYPISGFLEDSVHVSRISADAVGKFIVLPEHRQKAESSGREGAKLCFIDRDEGNYSLLYEERSGKRYYDIAWMDGVNVVQRNYQRDLIKRTYCIEKQSPDFGIVARKTGQRIVRVRRNENGPV